MNVHSQQIPQKAEGNPHHLYSGDVRSTTCTARLFYHKIVIFYSGSHHLKIRGIFVFKIRVACDCKWVDKCDFDFDATWQAGMAVRAADPQGREFKCLNSKHVCLVWGNQSHCHKHAVKPQFLDYITKARCSGPCMLFMQVPQYAFIHQGILWFLFYHNILLVKGVFFSCSKCHTQCKSHRLLPQHATITEFNEFY